MNEVIIYKDRKFMMEGDNVKYIFKLFLFKYWEYLNISYL